MSSKLRTLSARRAAALDQELMGPGAFSLDQLMELAGLAVAHVVARVHPPSQGPRVLLACGPGNNGGDGLVAARHLWHLGYRPTVYYPKRSSRDLLQRLTLQLENLQVPFTDDFGAALRQADHVVDALFGFSFSGAIREPFPAVITALQETAVSVVSVDIPSSWDVEDGPPSAGLGAGFHPAVLVSLTAPKPSARFFKGRHFVGGRFLTPELQRKYGLENYEYEGVDQIIEIEKRHD